MGGHMIKNGKVFKAHSKSRKGKCEPCNTTKPSLCCKQIIDTSTFQSYQTKQLMKCALCKVQYVGKAETAFNI